MQSAEHAIENLTLSLFANIDSQTSEADRRSLLAVQRAVRRQGTYSYLEIGSHLGGSIQQHLLDPSCVSIVSIDKRPQVQPDDRGTSAVYEDNSTDRMLDNLRRIDAHAAAKIVCFDADAKDIPLSALPSRPDYCFIDGEHTHTAALNDFKWCIAACSANGAILFHDAWIIPRAIQAILADLHRQRVTFEARKLGGSVFAIFLGDCPARRDPYVAACRIDPDRWLRWRALLWRFREGMPPQMLSLLRRVRALMAGS